MITNIQDGVTTMLMLLFFVALTVAWFTHIITCFATEAWGFLIAGAIFFPVGIFHGIYLWFT
jgi:hypothetical protein